MAEENKPSQFSLTPTAAHEYTTTTMSAPQLEHLTSRWLLKMLPWVQAKGGIYRVNRVASDEYLRIEFIMMGNDLSTMDPKLPPPISPITLTALLMLRGFHDNIVFSELVTQFQIHTPNYSSGETIYAYPDPKPKPKPDPIPADSIVVIMSGNATLTKTKDGQTETHHLREGDHFGDENYMNPSPWTITVKADDEVRVASITYADFTNFINAHPTLKAHIATYTPPPSNPPFEIIPRAYPLVMEQTVFSIPTRVADLYNDPMNQTQQQLKLVVERIREEQENRMINDPEFGLLNNVEPDQRIHAISTITTTSGKKLTPPGPHDLDRLITRHRDPRFLLAHPRAIAAIGRRVSQAGVYPESIEFGGNRVSAWRGIPLLSCTKIPVTEDNYSSILVLRTGEENEGVIGLTETGLPDEYEPGLNVRFMGVNKEPGKEAMISYLVTAYFSAAALVPSAIGVLDNVYVGEYID